MQMDEEVMPPEGYGRKGTNENLSGWRNVIIR